MTGQWVDPKTRRVTLGEYFPSFLKLRPYRPTTLDLYTRLAENHLLPTFGNRFLSNIDQDDVPRWLTELETRGVGLAARATSFRLLRAIMNAALRARLITWVPTSGVAPPKDEGREQRFLGAEDVSRLAEASPDRYHALIYLLAYEGLRIGEATALRVSDLNMLRGRLTISRSASLVNGKLIEGPTKTKKDRSVTLPRFLRDMLAEHIARFPGPSGYVFSGRGGAQLRPSYFRIDFQKAAQKAGLAPPRLRIHDLRHTCAALLIKQGAHAKEIAETLGHSNIGVTMDTYGHILPGLDERLAEGLEATFRAATHAGGV